MFGTREKMNKTIFLFTFCLVQLACAEAPIRTQGMGLSLMLAVPESKPAMTLRLMIANTGQVPEIVYAPFVNYTRLIAVLPNGKKTEVFNWKEGGATPPPLQPQQTTEWNFDITRWIDFKAPGIYRLSFSVNGRESNQIIVVKDKIPNQASETIGGPEPPQPQR